jgi:hypothetical protein
MAVFLCFHPLTLVQQANSHATVWFKNDGFPYVFMLLMGLTNGYFGSLCMMFGPSIVEAKDSEAAGSMMVCVCVCVCAFVCCVCVCVCMYVVCCVCVCVCASFPLMAIPQSTPQGRVARAGTHVWVAIQLRRSRNAVPVQPLCLGLKLDLKQHRLSRIQQRRDAATLARPALSSHMHQPARAAPCGCASRFSLTHAPHTHACARSQHALRCFDRTRSDVMGTCGSWL